jgi:hypothetical protein
MATRSGTGHLLRRRVRWGRVLLLGVVGCVLIVVALLCAYGSDIHHGVGVAACQERRAPHGYPPEGPRLAHRTVVPLGVACEFDDGSGRPVFSPETDWRATGIGLGGALFVVIAAVSLASPVRSRRWSDRP